MDTHLPNDEPLDDQAGEGSQSRALVPRQLDFYGDELLAIQDGKRQIWIHLTRLIECLGLSVSDQISQIRAHEVLGEGVQSFVLQTARGARDTLFLRLGLVPFYLATIQVRRVRPDLREKLLRYQKEAADVLFAAFLSDFGVIEPGRTQRSQGLTPAEQSYQQAQLLANLARQQLTLERELGGALEAVSGQQEVLALHDERIGQIELTLGTADKITEAQAAEIKEAVTAIGAIRGEQSGDKKVVGPTIQAVWKMFYREFGVRVYANLPRSKFDRAMQFLRETARQYGVELDKGGE
ncbi:MAG TPA: phage antirepressor N-terminal domain-containing protein [Ktedonobacteraceae bacterium]|nr:phage antirepressor N-terminal domain-containing protein [Ktedonobacteraceae bacterium]